MPSKKKQHTESRPVGMAKEKWWFLLGITLFAVILFRDVFGADRVLFTTDDNLGALAARKAVMPGGFSGWWNHGLLLGVPELLNLNWTNVLLWLLPVDVFADWIHAIDMLVASFCLGIFLRLRGRSWPACALAALTAFWAGSTFTLIYAGHIGKFGTVMFAAVYLCIVERAIQKNSVFTAVLAGGALGAMFLEQTDSAFFFALVLGPYALYALAREKMFNVKAVARIIAPIVTVAGILAIHPMWTAYTTFAIDDTSSMGKNPEQQWEYCTQWSWPPEETIDFIAPGYTGWRSGEATGPYWGRMGRSAGWEETGQGFRNFKLETFYLGALPVVFALGALFYVLAVRDGDKKAGWDVLFWSGAAFVTYLLALGKFFPLYRLFYELPGMSSIRNPVKFMQVTQTAIAVLAAYGMDSLCVRVPHHKTRPVGWGRLKFLVIGATVVGGLVGCWALIELVSGESIVRTLSESGWGDGAKAIVDGRLRALMHATVMTLAGGGALALVLLTRFGMNRRSVHTLAWIIPAVVAIDLGMLSRHYVTTMDITGYVGENGVIQRLKSNPTRQRTMMLSQGSFYNLWLTYAFPYHDIISFNLSHVRMPADYTTFVNAMGQDIARLARVSAIGYFLAPGSVWGQIQNSPFKDMFQLVYAYNVAGRPGGGVTVLDATQAQPGQHCVIRVVADAPRYALTGRWEVLPDDEAIQKLRAPDFVPIGTVLVSDQSAEGLPESSPNAGKGSVSVEDYRAGYVKLRVSAAQPSILRLSEKYHRDWKVYVDGKPSKLLRVDYIFQGVLVDPGLHEVVAKYAPANRTRWFQGLGMVLCLGAIAGVVREKRRDSGSGEETDRTN